MLTEYPAEREKSKTQFNKYLMRTFQHMVLALKKFTISSRWWDNHNKINGLSATRGYSKAQWGSNEEEMKASCGEGNQERFLWSWLHSWNKIAGFWPAKRGEWKGKKEFKFRKWKYGVTKKGVEGKGIKNNSYIWEPDGTSQSGVGVGKEDFSPGSSSYNLGRKETTAPLHIWQMRI